MKTNQSINLINVALGHTAIENNILQHPALAHHGVMTAYIDYAVGHTTSGVSALLAGYISNVPPAMMQVFNEKIFIVPPIQ